MPDLLQYPDRETLMENLAGDVAVLLGKAISRNGRATLAVPGGTTPAPFLRLLSKADIDWSVVNVLLTDERFVPPDSDRSNTRFLNETLLQNAAARANLVPLYQTAQTPESGLPALEQGVAAVLPIDVCVLGMGADMHTASLFPGADQLSEALDLDSDAILFAMRAPNAPEPRITLGAAVLRAARHIDILIVGPEKLSALDAALRKGPVETAPVRTILDAPGPVNIYYAD